MKFFALLSCVPCWFLSGIVYQNNQLMMWSRFFSAWPSNVHAGWIKLQFHRSYIVAGLFQSARLIWVASRKFDWLFLGMMKACQRPPPEHHRSGGGLWSTLQRPQSARLCFSTRGARPGCFGVWLQVDHINLHTTHRVRGKSDTKMAERIWQNFKMKPHHQAPARTSTLH